MLMNMRRKKLGELSVDIKPEIGKSVSKEYKWKAPADGMYIISQQILADGKAFGEYETPIVAGFLGAIMHIPSIISFPLAASLIRSGASVTVIATFITTLTMIGTVTFPLEIKELGKEMAALRNGISFIIAIIIGIIIGVIL